MGGLDRSFSFRFAVAVFSCIAFLELGCIYAVENSKMSGLYSWLSDAVSCLHLHNFWTLLMMLGLNLQL